MISSKVEKQEYLGKNLNYRHWAEINIQYTWNDKIHKRGKPSFASWAYDMAYWAKKATAAFPVGREVTLHVNPDNPAQAIVRAGATPFSKILIISGMILPVIGIIAATVIPRFVKF